MVRFLWHVEEGTGAHIPPGSVKLEPGSGVQHMEASIEVPGEAPLRALFTVPRGYLAEGKASDVGVLLGHSDDAEAWKGALLTQLAVTLAHAGHVVVRYHCPGSELRRQRVYEKALDVCATSPFARGVQRWVLGGVGQGARLAALVGSRVRGSVAGYLLLAFPLNAPLQTAKGATLADSAAVLLRVAAPALMVQPAGDAAHPMAQLRAAAARMKPEAAPRLAEVPAEALLAGAPAAAAKAAVKPVLEFVAALAAGGGGLDGCAPLANPPGTPAPAPSEAVASQVQLLDEDDAAVYEVEPLGSGSAGSAGAETGGGQQQPPSAAAAAAQQMQLQQQLNLQRVLQQAAVQRVAAAAAAAAAGGTGPAAAGAPAAPVVLPGLVPGQLAPQVLAAAQAMQLAGRPGAAGPGGAAGAAKQ